MNCGLLIAVRRLTAPWMLDFFAVSGLPGEFRVSLQTFNASTNR